MSMHTQSYAAQKRLEIYLDNDRTVPFIVQKCLDDGVEFFSVKHVGRHNQVTVTIADPTPTLCRELQQNFRNTLDAFVEASDA